MYVVKQLKTIIFKRFKKKGIWTKHYTMTLWNSEEELRAFTESGAHKEAMGKSTKIAKKIRTINLDVDKLTSWSAAKELLKERKVYRF